MHALILAAGDGERLHPLTDSLPKPLLRLRGRPIINHVLDALFDAGVDDATIVVGYHGAQIRDALERRAPARHGAALRREPGLRPRQRPLNLGCAACDAA